MARKPSYEELERKIRDLEVESAKAKRAEEALRQSEERYRGLVEESFDGIFIQEGPKIIYVNQRLNKMLGYLDGELEGQDHWVVYHPDYHSITRERAQARMRGEEPPSRYEVRLQRKDGTSLEVEILARAILLGGKPGVQVWIRDITQRKRAEEALRESEEKAKRTAQANSTMAEIGRIISSTLSIEDVYEQFAVEAKKIIPFDRIAIGLINHEQGTYHFAYTSGIEIHERNKGYTVHLSRIVREVIRGRSVCLLHLEKEEEFVDDYPEALLPFQTGVRSIMAAPLISRDQVVGVLYLASLRSKAYTERDQKLANEVATQIAGAIANVQLYGQLKLTEETLREGEKRYRDLYDEAPVGYHTIDNQGRITSINRQERLMLGYNAEEMLGQPVWNFVVDKEAQAAQEIIRARLAGLMPPCKGLERNFRRKDGTSVPVLIDDRLLTDDDGRITGIRTTVRDNTDRKRTEEEKEKLQAQLANALEMARLAPWEYDVANDLFTFNDHFYKIFRTTAKQVGGYTMASAEYARRFVHPDDMVIVGEEIRNAIEAIDPNFNQKLEHRILYADGTVGYISVRFFIVKDAHGRTIKTYGINQDITEPKRAEEEKEKLQAQLNQAQKMESVGRLAGGIAHDFNNMLGIIVGSAELAMQQVDPAAPLFTNIQEILRASQRSANLVRQLLAFARKQTVSPKVLDLNDTVPGMLKMLRRLIGEDINLAWIPGLDLWPVKIDPSQIDQILANLAVNARDAIAGVGRLSIETSNVVFDEVYCARHPGSTPGEYVLLAVNDEGAGMSEEALEHLFEPFFTTKEVGKGTGLGLATVYGIVKQNDGFISVYSEPGQGTTFRIYLPRFLETGVVEASVVPAEEEPPKGTETVLLVEDELGILYTTRDLLQMLGYRVLTAQTITEAMSRAEEHSGEIHLLITDVVMPEMNGRELAERLISMRPGMKTLFMSGYTADVIAHRGVLDPDVHFIEKPFSAKTLAIKVREVLDKSA